MIKVIAAGVAAVVVVVASWAAYSAGYVRLNYPSDERYPIRGIDVSHHQGAVDWKKVEAAGIDFAYIKATEGRDHRDPRFDANWRAAEGALARGAYHFFTFCT